MKLVRSPGIALGHAPWQGAILLLNHNREIKRAGSVIALPAHAISTKNKHLLLSCDTNPRFHGGSFGVWGTPPAKPLKCKSVSNRFGARLRSRWAEPTGGKPRLSCDRIRLALSDIIETSFRYHLQSAHLSLLFFIVISTKQKPPLTLGKQGCTKSLSTRYLLTSGLSKFASGVCPR